MLRRTGRGTYALWQQRRHAHWSRDGAGTVNEAGEAPGRETGVGAPRAWRPRSRAERGIGGDDGGGGDGESLRDRDSGGRTRAHVDAYSKDI